MAGLQLPYRYVPWFHDRIPGGKSDDMPESDFPADLLDEGQKVEMEHTSDPAIAREIAKDHLAEDLDYYKKLTKMEKGQKNYAYVEADHPRAKDGRWGDKAGSNEKAGEHQGKSLSPLDKTKEIAKHVGKTMRGKSRREIESAVVEATNDVLSGLTKKEKASIRREAFDLAENASKRNDDGSLTEEERDRLEKHFAGKEERLKKEREKQEEEDRRFEEMQKSKATVVRELETLGFKIEHESRGSTYYSSPVLNDGSRFKVRVSNHDVPETQERRESSFGGGFTWASSGLSFNFTDPDSDPNEWLDKIKDKLSEAGGPKPRFIPATPANPKNIGG